MGQGGGDKARLSQRHGRVHVAGEGAAVAVRHHDQRVTPSRRSGVHGDVEGVGADIGRGGLRVRRIPDPDLDRPPLGVVDHQVLIADRGFGTAKLKGEAEERGKEQARA